MVGQIEHKLGRQGHCPEVFGTVSNLGRCYACAQNIFRCQILGRLSPNLEYWVTYMEGHLSDVRFKNLTSVSASHPLYRVKKKHLMEGEDDLRPHVP